MKIVKSIKHMPTEPHFAIMRFTPRKEGYSASYGPREDEHYTPAVPAKVEYLAYETEAEWRSAIQQMGASGVSFTPFEALVPEMEIKLRKSASSRSSRSSATGIPQYSEERAGSQWADK